MMHLKPIEKKEEEQVAKLYKIINRKKITVSSDALISKSIKNISFIGKNEQDVLKRLIEVSLNRLLEKMVNLMRMKLLVEILYKVPPSVCFSKT